MSIPIRVRKKKIPFLLRGGLVENRPGEEERERRRGIGVGIGRGDGFGKSEIWWDLMAIFDRIYVAFAAVAADDVGCVSA